MASIVTDEKIKEVQESRKNGMGVDEACKKAGFSTQNYYYQIAKRKGKKKQKPQRARMALRKANSNLSRIVNIPTAPSPATGKLIAFHGDAETVIAALKGMI